MINAVRRIDLEHQKRGVTMKTHHAWLRRWSLMQDVALLMSVVMLVSSFTVSVASGAGQPSAAEITAPLQKSYQELGAAMAGNDKGVGADPKQVADRLEKLFQLLEEAERQIPRDTFDIKAIIQKVGTDPLKLFEWVRDETYLVPYRGVLRGDKGVLMDRLGNSIDRTMLLVALLRSVGQTVQLGHGTLTEKQAKEVLERARPVPKDGIPALRPSRGMPEGVLQKVAAQNQMDYAQLHKHIANLTAEQERMRESVMRRVSEQAAFIATAVGKPKEDIRKKEEAAAVAAMRDHWWVQWKKESTWVDLDTALPDAKPGKALANAQETIAPDKLPASLYHEVKISIVIEQWEENKLKEVPVLIHNLRPMEQLGEHIAVRYIPLKWPKDLDLLKEKDPAQSLKSAVIAQDEWLPVLRVGSTDVFKFSFTDSGETKDKTVPPIAEGFGVVGKNIFGRRGQPPGKAPKKDSRLTAEWIEYEIRTPGLPVQKIRREIFDLVGPAARSTGKVPKPEITEARKLERGLTLLGETEILPLVSQLSPQFVEHLITKNMLGNRNLVLSLFRSKDSLSSKSLNDQFSKLKPLSTRLYNLALARGEWSRLRGDVYLDRPNILSFHKNFHLGGKSEVLLHEGFDIVANDVAVRSGSETNQFMVRLEQGVLDTNAEALVVASNCREREDKSDCRQVENTSELFLVSRAQGTDWFTFRDADDPAWQSIKLPKDAIGRIKQELASGFTMMVPARPVILDGRPVVGWWRIDPKSGQVLGIGETGWGSGGEEAEIRAMTVFLIKAITISLVVAACLARASTSDDPCVPGKCLFAAAFASVLLILTFSAEITAMLGGIASLGGSLWPSCR